MAVIPKGYAKMEDLTITKDSISGPMEWKGVKFNFCMKVITEDERGEISDWENYVYNLYVDESKNIRDIRKYDSLSASLESIGIYDTIVGDVYTRNIIETERLYIEDFNGAVCYEISIPMHYNDDPDSIINEEQCISLIKTFGKQNCDYYDIVRCWNYFGIKETIIPKAYEEVNFETPAEEAIVN